MSMIKRDTEDLAIEECENIARDTYGRDFSELPSPVQSGIWNTAWQRVLEREIARAEMLGELARDRVMGV
jgi:hypothetical protein